MRANAVHLLFFENIGEGGIACDGIRLPRRCRSAFDRQGDLLLRF
jgi:hypothetical protein